MRCMSTAGAHRDKSYQGSWNVGDRGSITVEYTVLLSFVAVGCALAVMSLGAPLVRAFMAQETWLLMAIP